MSLMSILEEVKQEYSRATTEFGHFNSAHEGLGVIWEEFEELKQEVFRKSQYRRQERMKREAIHLATMAIRFVTDVADPMMPTGYRRRNE